MTATTTADAGTAGARLLADKVMEAGAIGGAIRHRNIPANYQTRDALFVAVLLLLGVGGFVTARLTSTAVHEPAARICSETCGPVSTDDRPSVGRREREKP